MAWIAFVFPNVDYVRIWRVLAYELMERAHPTTPTKRVLLSNFNRPTAAQVNIVQRVVCNSWEMLGSRDVE